MSDAAQVPGNDGTVPCSIVEAVTRLKERVGSTTDRSCPVDLLSVVVHRSTLRPTATTICQLWLRDSSLPPEAQAVISFVGSNKAVEIIQERNINVGDVVRFNRISLRQQEPTEKTTSKTLYEFCYDWQDPEAGPEFYRLGHIDATTGSLKNAMDLPVPPSMTTERNCLDRLVAWYRESELSNKRSEELTAPPCQYRSLGNLQSSLGVLSHIIARVSHVDLVPQNARKLLGGKRRREGDRCCALLTDGRHVLSFLDTEGRFRSVLQQAVHSEKPLRLSRVMAKISSNDDDEVVLVPTRESVAQLVTEAEFQERLSQTAAATASQLPFSLTQASQAVVNRDTTVARTYQVIAPILDIQIGSTSLAKTAPTAWKPSTFGSGRYYRSATVILDGEQQPQEVAVDGRILQALCGDMDLQEGEWSSRFLQGLLEERIPLRWTLEDTTRLGSLNGEACKHRVVRVSLPVFPL
jgi:hypothetical protein